MQRLAWLNGRNPFLMGIPMTRRFQPDGRTATPRPLVPTAMFPIPRWTRPSRWTPVTTTITIRAGWSLNDTVDEADLAAGTSFTGAGPTLTFTFPETSEDAYFWVAVPHAQDDLNYFHFSTFEFNQFGGVPGVVASVVYQGGAWKVWRSNQFQTDPSILSGVEVEVGSRQS